MKQKNKKPISELLKKKQIAVQQQAPPQPPSRSSSSSSSERISDSFEHSSDAEDFEDYKKDGYHPVTLGDQFHNGRFQVIQKLGWGHFSTVWLAFDKQTNMHVALKIQKSKQSYQESAIDELELLKELKNHQQDAKWLEFQAHLTTRLKLEEVKTDEWDKINIKLNETYCVDIVDNFIHYGMHGKHYCTAFEVLGPSLLDLIIHFDDYDKKMGVWLVKQITREILVGLVYMHEVCNIIHTDLKPENIMIQLQPKNFGEFVEQMKMYKKKPVSMKFLDKLKKTAKGNKKQEKKKKQKQKKLQQQQEKQPQQQIVEQPQKKEQEPALQIKEQEQIIEQKIEEKQAVVVEEKPKIQEPKVEEQNSTTLVTKTENNDVSKTQQETQEETQEIKQSQEETQEISQSQEETQEIKQCQEETQEIKQSQEETQEIKQSQEQTHHQHKHRNLQKEKEKAMKDKKKSKSKSEQGSSEEDEDENWKSDSEESESIEVDPETLYTLKWKDHIKIKLDKDLSIKIVDFGNACWTHKHFTDNIQTREYRAPEAILGIEYDTSTDIWSTACIVFELLTNDYLFRPRKGRGYKKSEDHLAQMMEVLGKMNKKWVQTGSYSREFFNKNGQLLNIKDLHPTSISKILIQEYGFSYQEALDIDDFLTPMLAFEPKKRVTAREALAHPWLNN